MSDQSFNGSGSVSCQNLKVIDWSRFLLKALMLSALVFASAGRGAAIVLEAENAVRTGTTISTAVPGYSGTGYVTGFDATGDNVMWTFNASNGLYRLQIRFRSQYGEKGFDATVNGSTTSAMFPSNSIFASFDDGLVELTNGSNTLQIGGGWNYYEIDRADLIFTNPPPPPLPVPATLANPLATLAARQLMVDLVANYGQTTWSGQHESNEVAAVYSASGRKPIIIAADLIDYSPSRIAYGANPGNYVEQYIGLENLGHVQSVMWHWNAPTNLINTVGHEWWRGFYTDSTTFDVAAALANTNSAEYSLLLRDIDAIAVQLKKFASNNIPVLWRPLHEAEGGWFWWGAKGPGPFKQLWRLLYNRLTVFHGLNNLIWVYSNTSALSPDWYPGNDVVDIVGTDAYPTDVGDPLSSAWQTLLGQFNGSKLLVLAEFGGVPDVEKMQRYGVWWCWFAPWVGTYGPSSMPTNTLTRIYQSAGVFTLDEANAIPPKILSVSRAPNGQVSLVGKGPRGQTNTVFVSSDLALPMNSWSGVYTGRYSGGVFTWSETPPTNIAARFYRTRAN